METLDIFKTPTILSNSVILKEAELNYTIGLIAEQWNNKSKRKLIDYKFKKVLSDFEVNKLGDTAFLRIGVILSLYRNVVSAEDVFIHLKNYTELNTGRGFQLYEERFISFSFLLDFLCTLETTYTVSHFFEN